MTLTFLGVLNAAFTALSIVGNEFIKRRNRRGYWFWLVGNALGLTLFVVQRQWITAALYVYFTVSCVQGLRFWTKVEAV
jgi:nicotinamide mononucleotide transporter